MKDFSNQSGAVLFTSLIFLLILTLIGLTALRESGLSERMSSNVQLSNIAFNAAESAIDRYIAEYNFNVSVTATSEEDVILKEARLALYRPVTSSTSFFEYCLDASSSVLDNYSLDKALPPEGCATTELLDGVAVQAKNRIEYLGCPGTCPNYSLGVGKQKISCHAFQMEAEGTVVNETTAYIDLWTTLLGPC